MLFGGRQPQSQSPVGGNSFREVEAVMFSVIPDVTKKTSGNAGVRATISKNKVHRFPIFNNERINLTTSLSHRIVRRGKPTAKRSTDPELRM